MAASGREFEGSKDSMSFGSDEDTCCRVEYRPDKQMNTIEIKTMSDLKNCFITDCTVISGDRLLLADSSNDKLKVVNIDTHSVVDEMKLGTYPWDITVLSQDQAAVTLPDKQEILILGTTGKLSKIRTLQVGRRCLGIVYQEDHLYVVCHDPNSLLMLDMQRDIPKNIKPKAILDQTFSEPSYIAVGKNGQTLYITDWQLDLVASLSLQGKVTGVYRHNELQRPYGMDVLEDGSLLVCCAGTDTIHHVSADLKQGRTLMTGILGAQSICYHAGNCQIYVCGLWHNQIKFSKVLVIPTY